MKKSLKPVLVFSLLLFTSVVLIVLGYVGIKLECEVLIKEKLNAQEKLETGINKKINFTAQYQLLNSEERITGIAKNELGMIKDSSSNFQLAVSSEEVQRISELLREKYE
jgi:cell division protein FtsB